LDLVRIGALVAEITAEQKETEMPKGQCHCGAVRYAMPAETIHRSLCHCSDCRRHSGAPMVAWGLVAKDQISIQGETREYASSEHGRRHFCPACGTSLFYTSEEIFPGRIDVQIATLDDPDAIEPDMQIQVADRIGWMARAHELPQFERYPE
jgi:hypothetical protein